jgi:6-pyruvoyltetrahydropterin/6-carboxytetrahydropterin synthase
MNHAELAWRAKKGRRRLFKLKTKYSFCAAHSLQGLPKDHKCGRVHGHNYQVEIVVGCKKLDQHGFVCDAENIDKIVHPLIATFDHSNLSDFMFQPTSERLARFIGKEILNDLSPPAVLISVEVKETEKISAIWEV